MMTLGTFSLSLSLPFVVLLPHGEERAVKSQVHEHELGAVHGNDGKAAHMMKHRERREVAAAVD